MSGWPARFAGVPTRAQTWRNLAYLLLAFPTGLVYFIVLVVGVATGVALAVVVVGLGILLVTLTAWRGMAAIERSLARALLRVPIPPPADRRELPRSERITRWLRDPVTWKSLIFVALKFPLGVLTFGVVVGLGFFSVVLLLAPLIVLGTPVTLFGLIFDSSVQALPLIVPGAVAGLLWLALCNGLGWLWALFARVMLGPSTVQLHERVHDLRDARARIIAAGDAERRRLERDLHDGAQQRLVALSLTLGMAEARLADPQAAAPLIAQAREEARLAVQELRDLARGIHPALLTERGLGVALEALAARAPVPTTVDGVPEERLPAPVEAAAYFVTAEALTNVAKYAGADSASVGLVVEHGSLCLTVRDDGAGGADPSTGSGLRGLRDRVEALDGRLDVDSPPGVGTAVIAEIPLRGADVKSLLGLLALILAIAGCGGGPRVTESREVGAFERLEVSGVDVTVVPGDGTRVRVRAGEDVMDRVRTASRDGVLRVDVPDRGIVIGGDPLGDVRVEVPVSALAGVRIDGSGDVEMTGIDADALELEVEGTGDIEASGTVGRLTVTLQGVGDMRLAELAARSAKVVVQGAADAELNVSDDLDVLIQGAGDVTYRGDPEVTSDVQGPGDVRREP